MGQLYRAKMCFTLLRVRMLGLLSYCCAGSAPKTNCPSIRPEGPDVGTFESGRQGDQGGRWIKTHSHIRDLEFEPVNILS